jgi:hypothetical protein
MFFSISNAAHQRLTEYIQNESYSTVHSLLVCTIEKKSKTSCFIH